jgi:Hydrogenase maturation factor
VKILVKGVVQGVGFRPTVARVAKSLGLKGYVRNIGSYVEIYVNERENEFLEELRKSLPSNARIDEIIVENGIGEYDDFIFLTVQRVIKIMNFHQIQLFVTIV